MRRLPPRNIRSQKRWVLWRKSKQRGKVPYQINGNPASITNPNHWSTWDECLKVATANPGKYGIGVVLGEVDGVCLSGGDFDHCLCPDKFILTKEVQGVVHYLNSYTEISPGGDGLHVLFFGKLSGPGINWKNQIELYSTGRFFTFTGETWGLPKEIRRVNITPVEKALRGRLKYSTPPEDIKIPPLKDLPEFDLNQLPSDLAQTIEEGVPEGERSELLFRVALEMARLGYSWEAYVWLLSCPDYGLAQAALDRGQGDVQRARRWLYKYCWVKASNEIKSQIENEFEDISEIASDAVEWPDRRVNGKGMVTLLPTIGNLDALLRSLGAEITLTNRNWLRWNGEETPMEIVRGRILSEVYKLKSSIVTPEAPTSWLHLIPNVIQFLDPLQDWARGLKWDGVPRLDDFIRESLVCDRKNAVMRDLLVRKWMIGAMHGLISPHGGTSPSVLCLVGAQGIGKTSWFRELVPAEHWDRVGTELMLDLHNKDLLVEVLSVWIAELGEYGGITKKADRNLLRAFITRKLDRYRLPYAREYQVQPRRTALGASSNEMDILKDFSGNRRDWLLSVKAINLLPEVDRTPIWAECKHSVERGEPYWVDTSAQKALNEHAEDYLDKSIHIEMLEEYFDWELPRRQWTTVANTSDIIRALLDTRGIHNRAVQHEIREYLIRRTGRHPTLIRPRRRDTTLMIKHADKIKNAFRLPPQRVAREEKTESKSNILVFGEE